MMKGPTGANGLAPVSMDSWYTLEMKRALCSHLPRPQPSELAQGRAHSELVVFCYQLSEPQPCSLVHTHVRQGGDSGREVCKREGSYQLSWGSTLFSHSAGPPAHFWALSEPQGS